MNAAALVQRLLSGDLEDNVTGATALCRGVRAFTRCSGETWQRPMAGDVRNRLVGNLLFGYWDLTPANTGSIAPPAPRGSMTGLRP